MLTRILLLLFLTTNFQLPTTDCFSQPSNNNCSGATSFGTLPTPSACPSGTGTTVSQSGTNVGATAPNPYTYIPNCTGGGNMAAPALDVWYSFIASGNVLVVSMSGTLASPNIGLYSGSCNSLAGMGCAIGQSNGNLAATTFEPLTPGQTYYLQVSGNNATATGNFTLTLQSNNDCNDCLQQATLTATPPPINGTYGAGQSVTFCYQIFKYTQVSSNWLHGVQIDFGSGWDLATLTTNPPASCSGSGFWQYYPGGTTSSANGSSWPAGFYYDYNSGQSGPGNNYGDYKAEDCDPKFCWTITTDAACTPGAPLTVTVNTSGDGESGSWTSVACQDDPATVFQAVSACCSPPTMSSTQVSCFGATDGTASGTVSGTASPWDYEWQDAVGTSLQTTMNSNSTSNSISNLAAGTYTLIVTDNNNCVTAASVTVTQVPGVTVNAISNVTICSNGTVAATNFTSSPAGATFTWINSNTAIGLAANGSGQISSFTATNTTSSPITSTITVTPTLSGCAGAPSTYTITVNPSPQITIPASSTICPGDTVTLSASYTPVPVIENDSFANYTLVQIPNGSAGGGGPGNSTVTSSGISPATLTSGQIISACFTVKHEDFSEISALSLTVGGTVYDNSNTPAIATLLASIQAATDNTATTFCFPASFLNTITGNSNTTWTVGVTDNVNGPDKGDILDFDVILSNTPIYTYSWTPTASLSGSTSGTTLSSPLTISAFPTTSTTYTVSVTNDNGCTGTQTVTVNVNNNLTVTVNPNPASICNGGTVTLTASGATNYTWSPSTGLNTTTGATVIANPSSTQTYTVIGISGGCSDTTTITVNVGNTLSIILVPTDITCNGSNNGSINNTTTGGTLPYTFNWSNSATTEDMSNLGAGNFSLTVTDNDGCTDTASASIAQPTAISLSTSQVNPGCTPTGSATITTTGGTTGYTYNWSTTPNQTTQTATGLAAGSYTVTVTDNNSCTATTSVTLSSPASVSANAVTTNILCNGNNNGSIDLTPSGGTSPYTYNWSNSATTQDISNLFAGSYTVTVTDSNNCTTTVSATVTEPASALTVSVFCTNESLPGANDGSSSSTPSGGTAPYTYQWSNTQTTQNISGLTANTYTVTATDNNGCTATASCSVNSGSCNLTASPSPVNILCNGANNGSATINASGGITPYSYTWSPNVSTSNSASNLAPGNYAVTVSDGSCTSSGAELVSNSDFSSGNTGFSSGYSFCSSGGCMGPEGTYGVGTNPNFYNGGFFGADHTTGSGNMMVVNGAGTPGTNVWCETISVTQGTTYLFSTWVSSLNSGSPAILQFSINGSTVGNTFNAPSSANIWSEFFTTWNSGSNVTAQICIVNQNTTLGGNDFGLDDISFKACSSSCTAVTTFTITQPSTALSATTTCTGESVFGANDGTSSAAASGGTTNYSYQWSNSQTTQNISGLAANTYTVTVTDGNGCTAVSSCAVAAGLGCDLNQIRSTFTGAGCTELANCLSACSIYFYNPQSMTGDNAQAFAQQYGANLVSVQSATENSCLVNNLNSLGLGGVIWIGFNDVQNEGSFVWYDQSPIVYTNWAGGEPNQAGDEDCVQIYPGGSWNDLSCSSGGSSSVIEVNLCPSPTIAPSTMIVCPGQSTTLSVNTILGSPPYTYSWASSPAGFSSTASNPTVNPTEPISYFVTVTDRFGCISETSINITGSGLASTSTQTNVLCFGGNSGTATITANSGETPYSYTWTGSSSIADTALNLSAGNYSATVSDAAGCTSSQNFTITEPSTSVDVTLVSQTNISCNGANDGAITVTTSGGNSPYSYQWLNMVSNSNIAINLAPGTQGVFVNDANECLDTMTFLITEPPALASSTSQTDVSCFGGNDGSASLTVSGGTTDYSYSWSNSVQTQNLVSLTSNIYSVTITDANGCTDTQTFNITEPAAALTLDSSSANVLCNGDNNGSATVIGAGGTAPYSYLWSNTATTSQISTLSAGNYSVTCTDAKSCVFTQSFNITQPSLLSVTVSSTNVKCNSACDGNAVSNANGGIIPYTYSWSDGQNGAIDTALCAGNYSLNILDANNCSAFSSFIITEPSQFSPTTDSINSNCQQNDGSAGITVTGATAPYQYLWDDGQTTATASNIVGGVNHCVTVTDANSCDTVICILVNDNPPPTAQASAATTICYGDSNGTASVTPQDGNPIGNPTYTILWSNNQTQQTLFSLPAGIYTVTVTDGKNCTATATTEVLQPSEVIVSVSEDDTICIGESVFLTAVADSGNGSPYTYFWDNDNSISTDTQTVSPTSLICYIVSATDKNDCPSQPDTVCIDLHPPVFVDAGINPQIICNNDQVNISIINSGGGNGGLTFLWTDENGNTVNSALSQFPPGVFGDTVNYFVVAQNECPSDSDTVSVTFYPNPVANFLPSTTFGCEPVKVVFTNTSTPQNNLAECTWEFGDGFSITGCGTVSNTYDVGTYFVQLEVVSTDGDKCRNKFLYPFPIEVYPYPDADFSASPQPTDIQDMNIKFTDLSSGNGSNLLQWNWFFYDNDQTTLIGNDTAQNPQYNFSSYDFNSLAFSMSDTGDYPVTLIVITKEGCPDTIRKIIHIDGTYLMNIPNAFTPDGDGLNDYFFPSGIGILEEQNFNFYVFNRWGDVIFKSNSLNKGWNGNDLKGAKAPQGVYVWRLDLDNVIGEHQKILGQVTVIRRGE